MGDNKLNMLDILLLIAKNKKFVFFFTLIMSILAVTYSLVVEEQWTSEMTLMPKEEGTAISMAGSVLGGLGLGGSFSLQAASNKYVGIMLSKAASIETVNKFNLIDYFKIENKDPLRELEDAVKSLHNSILTITIGLETNYINLKAKTNDREFSKKIAQHYLDYLMHYTQENTNNSGRQKRELFEKRIDALISELDQVNEEMRLYQQKHNIIHVETQAIATIQSYSKIVDELLMLGFDLKYIERFMSGGTRHADMTSRRDIITETMQKLETNTKESQFVLPLNKLNDHIFVIQDFMVKQLILQKTLETIFPQLELARIEEIDMMERFEVIEPPTLPGKRSFPARALICIIVFTVSLLASCTLVLIKEFFLEEEKEKIILIWKTLFR